MSTVRLKGGSGSSIDGTVCVWLERARKKKTVASYIHTFRGELS
jgi:hypothetical protein